VIEVPSDLGTWLEADRTPVRILLVEPGAESCARRLDALCATPPPEAVLLAGPEGGWTAQELDLLRSRGVLPLSLGSLTFRAELAALMALAALFTAWDAW
jgi:16S rRNA (uracil1498-N3)-methyltransferase